MYFKSFNSMKYKFQVMVALTNKDKDIEVEVELSDNEVAKIKKLVAANVSIDKQPQDEDDFVPEPDLLQILEDGEPKLFEKFWDIIMPRVFVEMLIDGFNNGYIEKGAKDGFDDYHEADFDELYEMYGDEMELEHSSCCICRIPETFISK